MILATITTGEGSVDVPLISTLDPTQVIVAFLTTVGVVAGIWGMLAKAKTEQETTLSTTSSSHVWTMVAELRQDIANLTTKVADATASAAVAQLDATTARADAAAAVADAAAARAAEAECTRRLAELRAEFDEYRRRSF